MDELLLLVSGTVGHLLHRDTSNLTLNPYLYMTGYEVTDTAAGEIIYL